MKDWKNAFGITMKDDLSFSERIKIHRYAEEKYK